MTLTELAELIHGKLSHAGEQEFSEVGSDSRQLPKGAVFFALRGEICDGHDFLQQATHVGAVALVVSKPVESNLPTIMVDDTLLAFQRLAKWHRQQYPVELVAITGSCGKTTAKRLLHTICRQVAPSLTNQGSYNNHFGVPLTLLQIDETHRFVVQELGANHSGEIAALTHLCKPKVAVLTCAALVHIEGFGSLDGVACAKSEIFQGLGEDGTAIINADDQYADFWRKRVGTHQIISFGIDHPADVTAQGLHLNREMQPVFQLKTPLGETSITLPLLGRHNVYNALAAAAAAVALGIEIPAIKKGLESAKPEKYRLNVAKGPHNSVLINDSYNANPKAMVAAIDLLQQYTGTKILVMADMGELGDEAEAFHREVGRYAKERGIDFLYCYGPLSQGAADEFGAGGYYFDNKSVLIESLTDAIDSKMAILIKGSNSMKMWEVAEALQPKESVA